LEQEEPSALRQKTPTSHRHNVQMHSKSYEILQPKRTKLDWNCDPAKSATPKGSKVGLFTALFSLQAGLLLNAINIY
jgi:hypothetical protein